jgi:hypothetical protein
MIDTTDIDNDFSSVESKKKNLVIWISIIIEIIAVVFVLIGIAAV